MLKNMCKTKHFESYVGEKGMFILILCSTKQKEVSEFALDTGCPKKNIHNKFIFSTVRCKNVFFILLSHKK
jgi:hypothetical protein